MLGGSFDLVPTFRNFDKTLDFILAGDIPIGTKSFRENILDAAGNKVGERVIHTYSSGSNKAPKNLVSSNFPPCNIYVDENKRKVYEFACSGYAPGNISFKAGDDIGEIKLVLKSGLEDIPGDQAVEADANAEKKAAKVYDFKGFSVKDHTTTFFVDVRRYDVEDAIVEVKNGVAKISFAPKAMKFNPKIVSE